MATALQRLSEEDPTFRVRTDEETAQTIISGMGELHLEIIVDRMMREFGVQANVGKPQVAYRETITQAAEGERTASSGRPAARACSARRHAAASSRRRAGQGLRVRERRSPAARFPSEYIPAVREGRRRGAWRTASSPATRWWTSRSTLVDGSYHDVDSLGDGVQDRRLDGVQGGRARRRKPASARADHGRRSGGARGVHGRRHRRPDRRAAAASAACSSAPTRSVIAASVPLAEMFGYATRLRSITQGRAVYSMQFSRYETLPQSVAEEIVAKASSSRRSSRRTGSGPARTQRSGRPTERVCSSERGTDREGRSSMAKQKFERNEAARERGDDRPRGPREDDADGGDHDGAGAEEPEDRGARLRLDRQRAGRARARDHDRDGARGVRDGRSGTTRTWTARATPTT